MTTMLVRGVSCTVVYVDSTATGANDGSSPADALLSLPAAASLTANTIYLIRRGHTQTWTVGTCATTFTFVVGMPVSTDPLYVTTPTEAKTAWDADAATHVTLTMSSAGNGYVFSGADCGWHRIDLKNPGDVAVIAGNGTTSALTSSGVRFSMTFCRYTTVGYNLTTATSPHAQNITNLQFNGNEPFISDCYFEFPSSDSVSTETSTVSSFNVTGTGVRATMRNVVMWVSGSRNLHRGLNGLSFREIDNVAVHYVENRAATTIQGIRGIDILLNGSGSAPSLIGAVARNLSFTYERYFTGNAPQTPTTVGQGQPINLTVTGYNLVIDDIDIDLTAEPGQYRGLTVTSSGTARGTISNVTVTKATSPILAEDTTSVYACSITGTTSTTDLLLLEDCTLSAPQSAALIATGILGKNLTLDGFINLTSCDGVEVVDWTMQYSKATAITLSASLLHIASATLAAATQASLISGSLVLIDEVDEIVTAAVQTSGFGDAVIVNNQAGVTGRWYGENYGFIGNSTNVYRTGGATCAVKVEPKVQIDSTYGLWMAPTPMPAHQVPPGGTGTKTFTLYIATKGYPTTETPQIRMLVEAPIGVGEEHRTYDSALDGVWETDTSTWNNDTGLTKWKLTMQVPVDRDEDCGVRIHHQWFKLGGYLYIDPKVSAT